MKRFYVLITFIFFVTAADRTCLSEEIINSATNTTQVVIEPEATSGEAVLKEDNNEENMTQTEWEERERNAADKALFEKKCGKCHSIERPLLKKKTRSDWNVTVERMQKKDLTWILPAEAIIISDYLFKTNGLKEDGIGQDTTFQLKKFK